MASAIAVEDDDSSAEATAGLDVQYEPTKNQFTDKPEGLRQFRDHRWKALGKENPNLR